MKTIQDLFDIAPDLRGDYMDNEPGRYIGIEVELENLPGIGYMPGSWQVTEDGSIRNNGREFVSMPLKGIAIDNAVDELYNLLLHHNPEATFRTGIHVHVDVRDFTAEEYTKLNILYAFAEPMLYRYCGRIREQSNFCAPLYQTPTFMQELAEVCDGITKLSAARKNSRLYAEQYEHMHYVISHKSKYPGFNINRVARYGDVEFRMHPGTYFPSEILDWVDLVTRLVNAAKDIDTPVDQLLQFMSGYNMLDLTRRIFGEHTPKILGKYESMQLAWQDMRKGVLNAQDMTLATILAKYSDELMNRVHKYRKVRGKVNKRKKFNPTMSLHEQLLAEQIQMHDYNQVFSWGAAQSTEEVYEEDFE